MKRETSNMIRFVLEDIVPPILRDSPPAVFLYKKLSGLDMEGMAALRRKAAFLSPEEMRALYEDLERIHDESDNSAATVEKVLRHVTGSVVCDIGCGPGHLVGTIKERIRPARLVGLDFVAYPQWHAMPEVEFVVADVARLPFCDGAFDTVVCTHVIEHVLDIRAFLSELRRIAGTRLVIVVPRERESLYCFNTHLHFFPYKHSFLKHITPVPDRHHIEYVGRDIFYVEDGAVSASPDPFPL